MRALASVILVLLPGAHAVAQPARPCDLVRHPGLAQGPITIGFFSADMGAGRRACPRTEVGLGARLGAVIDTPGFYGSLAADALLYGSYAPGGRAELFGTLELLRYHFVQNASLKGTSIGLGQLTVGGSLVALAPGRWVLSPYGKLMLPTASAVQVQTMGFEAGAALAYHPLDRLSLHGFLGAQVSAGISAAPSQPRAGVGIGIGLQYAPLTWLALALDLQVHLGHRSVLDYLAPALGLRFRLYRNLGAEIDATLPVLGADRRLFLAALRIQYRF